MGDFKSNDLVGFTSIEKTNYKYWLDAVGNEIEKDNEQI